MAGKLSHKEIERATAVLDRFVGVAGHDVAEAIQQQAHVKAGGNDMRRSNPAQYDTRYLSDLKQQLWPMDKSPDFWAKIQERYNAEMERPGGFDRNGDFNTQLRAFREAMGLPAGSIGKALEERRQQQSKAPILDRPGTDTDQSRPGLLGMNAATLAKQAKSLNPQEQKDLFNAKDTLESFMNFICLEDDRSPALFAKIHGAAERNGEIWVSKSGLSKYDQLANLQHRVPGEFLSLRDQLIRPDGPQELQRAQSFWKDVQGKYKEYARKGQSAEFMDKISPALEALGLDPTAVQRDLKAGVVGQRVDARQDGYVRISHFSPDGRQGPTDLSAKTFAVAAAAIIPALSEPGRKVAPAVLNI